MVSITSPDGDVTYLTTAAYLGAPNIVYAGQTYLARIQKNEILPIQAISPQGYDTIPGFTLTLADADLSLWTNHCMPHGWRGASVILTFIEWDLVNNAYSTDAYQWTFIGGNPQHDHRSGSTTLDVGSANNFTRLKVPSIPLEYRCPWAFPGTAADRAAALNDPTSVFFQCGYSPDQAGGIGNYATGTTPFTTCDLTRSGGPTGGANTDPSVGCMARLGNAATTSVAPDGDLDHDKAGNYTARFGGITLVMPAAFSGFNGLGSLSYILTGVRTYGFNQPNTALIGSYYNWVYGTQWVTGQVLAPAADANSLRSEIAVCTAAFGAATILKVIVNGVEISRDNKDILFLWRFAGGPGSNAGAGGRSGRINGDNYFSNAAHSGLGDPHGSQCVLEVVLPAQLAQPGSIPTCQVLVTSGPMLTVDSGGAFVYAPPSIKDGHALGAAANAAFAYLDLMTWGNVSTAQINPMPWYNAAQKCAAPVSYIAADGSTQTHAQFKASFQLPGSSRQTLAQVLTALRNSANLMVGQNPLTGLYECYVKETLADQQPAAIAGSNDTTARTSPHADSTIAVPDIGSGYYAYVFDETNIEAGSFKITTTRIESTPNTVAFAFQDEENGYQQDSLTEIDPASYAYSGNQQIAVPVPINAVPNFDQGTRVSNVQLAEALYGNPRDDAGGTLYFEFSVNQRVIHLANRLGYICGLFWQPEGIGTAILPQAVRLLSLKPDTDGEHWQVKLAWHSDEWYTYAYGQNPTPFKNNPLLSPSNRPPYPWRPGVAVWGSGDALFPNQDSFAFDVDTSQYPAQLKISGNVPSNGQPVGKPPIVPLLGTTGNTGGAIKPGTYSIQFSTNGVNGPVSYIVSTTVPVGTNTNTITVSGIQWPSGAAPSILPYIGSSSMTMHACDGSSYAGSVPDANGNPTQYVFSAFTPDGLGLPDNNFAEFVVQELGIEHGGVWGDAVTTLVSANVLAFAAGAWSINQWAGHVLSLYYRPGVSPQPALNMAVSSNTATELTMAGAGFLAGDIVVMRPKSAHITANTIGDDNFVNSYAPGGLANNEAGFLIQIIAGTGAGYPAKTILSNTTTVYTIQGAWDVLPAADTIFIVLAPDIAYSTPTSPPTGGSSGPVVIATTKAVTSEAESLFVQVAAVASDGITMSPWQYQPFREVYIPLQSAVSAPVTRVMTASGDIFPSDSTVLFDTSAIAGTTTTLGAAITVLTSPLVITLTSGAATLTGTYIQIGAEILYILLDGGTTTPTVERGMLGTTAATHINGATVDVPGALAATLPAIITVPNQPFTLHKITTDLNYVKVLPAGSDLEPSGGPYILLADTSPGLGTSGLLAPGTGNQWIQTSGAGPVGVAGPPGPSGSGGTPAPNITSATAAAAYFLVGNISSFGFSGVITLPTGDPDYAVLLAGAIQIMVYAPGDTKGTQIAWLPGSMFGGSTVSFNGGQYTQDTAVSPGWTVQFNCYNSSGSPTASPIVVGSISVQASLVSSVTATESTATRTVDPLTRQIHCHPVVSPVLNGNEVPQNVTFWVSQNGGASYALYGVERMATVGQTFSLDLIAPVGASTWYVKAAAGWVPSDTPPGVAATSGPITVVALPLPAATLVTSLTIPAGAGGSFPYDVTNADNTHQWRIGPVSFSDAGCLADINAYVVQITVQGIDATGTPVVDGIGEHLWQGFQISKSGATQVPGFLQSDYGGAAPPNPGIAYLRYRVYVINRAEQATGTGWKDLVNVGTLQTGGGGNLNSGHLDVLVATGGATPFMNAVTAVAAGDASALATSDPKYKPRYSDINGSVHVPVYFVPTLAIYGPSATAAVFVDLGDGLGWRWWENITVLSAGQAYFLQTDEWAPTSGAATQFIACSAGYFAGDATTGITLPSTAVSSPAFTVAAVGLCATTDLINATFVADGGGNQIEYLTKGDGTKLWNYFCLTFTQPGTQPGVAPYDVNYWSWMLTVQKGYELSGVWHPAPDYEGVNADPNGTYQGRITAGGEMLQDPNSLSTLFPPTLVQQFGDNPPDWTYPPNIDPVTSATNLYRTYRFWLYAVSRLGTTIKGGGGTPTLQATWPGGANHFDLTPVVHPDTFNFGLVHPSTVPALFTKDGNGVPQLNAGAITHTYLAASAVQANNMTASSVTAANAAIAASAVVDSNIVSLGINKVTYGTSVFAGDVILSRGVSLPVMVLQSGGLYLYGQADASTGATGLTSKPYVAVQNSGILVASGGNPSVLVNSIAITLYSVNGSTTNPFVTMNSTTGITVSDGSGLHKVVIDSSGVTITGGVLTSPTVNGGTITGSKLIISATSGSLTENVTIDPSSIASIFNYTFTNTGISSSTIMASGKLTISDAFGSVMALSSSSLNISVGASLAIYSATQVAIGGNRIIGARQAGPGSPAGFADSVAQTWCQNFYNAFRASGGHGLVN